MGAKRVLTAVITACSILLLASCGDTIEYHYHYDRTDSKITTTQKKATTTKKTTNSSTVGKTTTKKTTTKKTTTKATTTHAHQTTTRISSKQKIECVNKLKFYCWNNEFKNLVDDYYSNVNAYNATTTYLLDGTYIEWTFIANAGSNYQDSLDTALGKDEVDMFAFEADYASKYVYSDKVADLTSVSRLNLSKQYKYTKDIVTNGTEIKGVSWMATPGVTIYNKNVSDSVWGTWNGEVLTYSPTITEISNKLSTETNFKNAAIEVKNANKFMMIGPDDWYKMYTNNISTRMWDGTDIIIAPELFDWVNDTMDFYKKRYIRSVLEDYGLWGTEWGAEQGKDDCLCIFSVPWFTDYCLKGNRYAKGDNPDNMAIKEMSDANLRMSKSYKPWFWGGIWITATETGLAKDTITSSIEDLIKAMTTDKDTLKAMAKGTNLFVNNQDAINDLVIDDSLKLNYFGGQNPFAIYSESITGLDLSNASKFDQTIIEEVQTAFKDYFQGWGTAVDAWENIKTSISTKTGVNKANIKLPNNETSIDNLMD